jgi:hypothetical protein
LHFPQQKALKRIISNENLRKMQLTSKSVANFATGIHKNGLFKENSAKCATGEKKFRRNRSFSASRTHFPRKSTLQNPIWGQNLHKMQISLQPAAEIRFLLRQIHFIFTSG